MGIATAVLSTKGSNDDCHEVVSQPKLKLTRLKEPTNEANTNANANGNANANANANTTVVDCSPTLDLPSSGCDALSQISSDSLQQILGFLQPRDRFALLSTQRKLVNEPLATSVVSYCGRCADCVAQNEHLCGQAGSEIADATYWTCVMKRCDASALKEVRLANCDAFSASTLLSVNATTRTAAFGKLPMLELKRCEALGADGLRLLAGSCSSLQELRLRDMVIDSQAFAALVTANKATLRVVDLEGCHTMTADDVRCLAECPQLTKLSLAGCYNVDNAAIADVVRACRQLQALNLRFCHKIDDILVEKIAVALPMLQELNLRYCMKITDAAVHVICDRLLFLATLDLSQCSKITDAAVGHIVRSLKALKFLRLWACGKLTSAAVHAISEASPSLELVDIRSRDRLEAVIGGRDGLHLLARKRSRRWEMADQLGVFKRLPTCAVAV